MRKSEPDEREKGGRLTCSLSADGEKRTRSSPRVYIRVESFHSWYKATYMYMPVLMSSSIGHQHISIWLMFNQQ